jgi:2,3-bisphosphoglycerate-independent phosphoglycerate mutase
VVRRVLLVLDGAPEPVLGSGEPTTLEAARTPALDALCATGTVARLATTPGGLEPGSETGLPVLLGAPPAAQVGRGPIEAAAAGIEVAAGERAWRLDLRTPGGTRASDAEGALLVPLVAALLPRHAVRHLRGHRLLAVGRRRPALACAAGLEVHVWPDGTTLRAVLDARTTIVCGPGAAAGIGRLLGARVDVPAGATGDVDTDLAAKARAAERALAAGGDVVVHVGAADEAAHRRDAEAKRAALEAIDERLVRPLSAAARRHGAVLAVTADHGTCPRTGRHDSAPVPLVVHGAGVAAAGPARLTERAVAGAPVAAGVWAAVPAPLEAVA